ncbi:t-SNARE [Cantharellus anzutake]|uniref:t-SNARE n=1 Tax=Cantharellus anzutake TaxID=1750568 RepID=UPI001903B010|nr:t-SNARE [Cantharellus anzutake]KAF8321991.1 t-SNARE [Cantharellus anzutake]
MSFNDFDIERGTGGTRIAPPPSGTDFQFTALQSSLSIQVFKINANVQGILKLVDQLGTGRDTPSVRNALHNLTEATRDMVKRGSEDLKRLVSLGQALPHQKTLVQKTSHDMQLSLVAFQKAQRVSAERQRTVVEDTKLQQQQQQQQHIQQQTISPAELAFQESLIQEREGEIREIESGIHELNEIFRDLGTLVTEQGEMLDNIENNITSVARDTHGANEELGVASEYQRKAGRRAACLLIVVAIVICVVLLAVSDFGIWYTEFR